MSYWLTAGRFFIMDVAGLLRLIVANSGRFILLSRQALALKNLTRGPRIRVFMVAPPRLTKTNSSPEGKKLQDGRELACTRLTPYDQYLRRPGSFNASQS